MGLHLPSHSRQAQPFYKEGAEATAPAPSGDIDVILFISSPDFVIVSPKILRQRV